MAHDGLPRLDGKTALFLDIDGTLVDIAPVPDAVMVAPGLGDVLQGLRSALDGALALVSGRPLAGIDALFAPLRLPAAGQHGAELRLSGDVPPIALARDPALDIIAEQATEIAVERPGVLVEDKGLSIAIHYRLVPQYRDEVHRLAADLVAASGADIELLPVRMGVELKPRAISKASAIEWFMREPPFRGRVPVFVGDDRTDEFGFAAVLKLGGHAIRVGNLGPSLAPLRIASPHAVRDWLAEASITLR